MDIELSVRSHNVLGYFIIRQAMDDNVLLFVDITAFLNMSNTGILW